MTVGRKIGDTSDGTEGTTNSVVVLGEDPVIILDTAMDVSIVPGPLVVDLGYPVDTSVVVLLNVNINASTTGEIPKHRVFTVGVSGPSVEDMVEVTGSTVNLGTKVL